jgi:S1-C subfamily serine protease
MTIMLRALVLATLISFVPGTPAVQKPSVLHIMVVVKGSDGKATPVPRYLLLISENPASALPRRVTTALDGTVEVRLPPGNYTVESDQPFAFQGKTYQWTEMLNIVAGRDAVLELTADNAEVGSASAATATSSVETESAMVLAQWQDSVVSVWTPTAHASGFAIDASGLIATNQRVVGTAASVEVQLTMSAKALANVLVTNQERDVAILWIDPKIATAVRPVPTACGQTSASPLSPGQKVLAIGTTLGQQKRMTMGTMSGRAAHLVSSDLTIPADSAGGPVFSAAGAIVGLATLLPEEVDGDARVVPLGDVCDLIASAQQKMKVAAPPNPALLPVDPVQAFPVDALKEGAKRRDGGSLTAYRMTSSDFDIAFITPVMLYAAQNPSEEERRRQLNGVSRAPAPGQAAINPLENFSNWSRYVADVPPVLLIRVTPKLVEGFWTKVARGAAQVQGMSLPPIKRFKAGFSRLRAFCGDTEIAPIHPFKLEQRVSETDAIYEGLYVFDPAAIAPSCGGARLVLYSEKDPGKGDTRVIDPKMLQQIWDDFAPLRALLPAAKGDGAERESSSE